MGVRFFQSLILVPLVNSGAFEMAKQVFMQNYFILPASILKNSAVIEKKNFRGLVFCQHQSIVKHSSEKLLIFSALLANK